MSKGVKSIYILIRPYADFIRMKINIFPMTRCLFEKKNEINYVGP